MIDCQCGCGREVRPGSRFISGHNRRLPMDWESVRLRILANSKVVGECLVWQGGCNSEGYGRTSVGGHREYVHRLIVLASGIALPRGMVPDHTCENPPCVLLKHLVVVTHGENIRRGKASAKSPFCKSGRHLFTEENTYYRKTGGRLCRACHREYGAAKRLKEKVIAS